MTDTNQDTCCVGRIQSSVCVEKGWLPGSEPCKNLPSVQSACNQIFKNTLARKKIGNFYPGTQIDSTPENRLTTVQPNPEACLKHCETITTCGGVTVEPATEQMSAKSIV